MWKTFEIVRVKGYKKFTDRCRQRYLLSSLSEQNDMILPKGKSQTSEGDWLFQALSVRKHLCFDPKCFVCVRAFFFTNGYIYQLPRLLRKQTHEWFVWRCYRRFLEACYLYNNNIGNEFLLILSWSESGIVVFMKQSSAYVVIIMYN